MPQRPNSTFAPIIDVDDSEKYLVELVAFDEQPSQFREKRRDAMMDTYKFNMWNMTTGEAVIDEQTGEMYELWKICNDLLYDNPATNKMGPGRELANALVGHRLTDEEVDEMLEAGWGESLIGKKAIADVEWQEQSDGTQRLRLLRLKPQGKQRRRVMVEVEDEVRDA